MSQCNAKVTLQWRHNGHRGASNQQPYITGLCAGNWPVAVEISAQRASNEENVSIWWRRHACHIANFRGSNLYNSEVKMASFSHFRNCPKAFSEMTCLPNRLFHNEQALVQIMDWPRTCKQSLIEAKVVQFSVPRSWWVNGTLNFKTHYNNVIMSAIASQITSLTIVYSSVYSGADQRKHQSSASLAFVRGIHRRPVNSPHKGPVTRKMFPFDDVIMTTRTFLPSVPAAGRSGHIVRFAKNISEHWEPTNHNNHIQQTSCYALLNEMNEHIIKHTMGI